VAVFVLNKLKAEKQISALVNASSSYISTSKKSHPIARSLSEVGAITQLQQKHLLSFHLP